MTPPTRFRFLVGTLNGTVFRLLPSHCRGGYHPPARYNPIVINQVGRIRTTSNNSPPTVGEARSLPRSIKYEYGAGLGEFVQFREKVPFNGTLNCGTWREDDILPYGGWVIVGTRYHSTERSGPLPGGRLRASPTPAGRLSQSGTQKRYRALPRSPGWRTRPVRHCPRALPAKLQFGGQLRKTGKHVFYFPLPSFRPSCQKATALAAATFSESTPWDMGIFTV